MSEDRYDASETEDRGSSHYFSRRDLRNIGIAILILLALSYPVYKLILGQSEKAICSRNLASMSNAMGLYMEENNGRFPPAYVSASNGSPLLIANQRSYTWNSVLSRYMREGTSFECPTATDAEVAHVLHPESNSTSLPVTYGLYLPYAGYLRDIVPNPSGTVIIAETSNMGANDTLDPLPFETPDGKAVPNDAFVIGFDDDNFFPTGSSRTVTRLALPGIREGDSSAATRHNTGIRLMFMDGSVNTVPSAKVGRLRRIGGEIGGYWTPPPRNTLDYTGN